MRTRQEVKGNVRRWFPYKGYGFIAPDDGSEDVFVHNSNIVGRRTSLTEREKVEFDVETTFKGPRAVNVEIISE